jgi:hypothetical protein
MSEINYIENKDGTKLFSFYRHDYKEYTDKEGNFMMIDGGMDYIRYSVDEENSWLNEAEISDVIQDIREQYKWGRNYDKNMNKLLKTEYILLKDLDTEHIFNIITYILNKIPKIINYNNKMTIEIFVEELKYRYSQGKIISY